MKIIARILALAAVLPLVACQTTQSTSSVTSAVMCDKCQTVWVKRPETVGPPGKGGSYVALRTRGTMTCPDCQSAVVTFFKTGQLKHSCSHCGGTISHCEAH
jgi:hypothetical protein